MTCLNLLLYFRQINPKYERSRLSNRRKKQMLLSRSCEYAIQAVLYLAENREQRFISIKEIAEKNDISFHFLGKILQSLTKKGLVISSKGPKGGVNLAKDPNKITLLDIVEAIDGLDFLISKCIIGTPGCDCNNPCKLHDQWGPIRKQIFDMLGSKSIAELI